MTQSLTLGASVATHIFYGGNCPWVLWWWQPWTIITSSCKQERHHCSPMSSSFTSWSTFMMGPSNVPLWGFPMETLKRLSTKLPTSIGVVTHGTSSHQVGKVPSLGASRHEALTGVPSACFTLKSLITFKQQTRTMFISVECNVIKFHTHCWGVWTWLTYQRHNGLY